MIRTKKWLCLVLAMVLLLSCMPVQVMAEEMESTESMDATETDDDISENFVEDDPTFSGGSSTGDPDSDDQTVVVVASGTCGENLTWRLDGDYVLTITGTGPMADYESAYEQPWHNYCDSIVSVVIEEGVTSVGTNVFGSDYVINSVTIPTSVTSIGMDALKFCGNLKGIWVDENNTVFSSDFSGVLFNKEKTEILCVPGGISGSYTIPDGVTGIEMGIFSGLHNLTGVTIPASVTSIGNWAFLGCSSLDMVIFEGNVPLIGSSVFEFVTATAYYPANNATWTSDVMWGYGGTLTWQEYGDSIIIDSGTCGENLTWKMNIDGTLTISGTGEMEGWALADEPWYDYKDSITAIVIEDGVTGIGVSAFWGCDKITTVIIPDSVTSVDYYAFASCDNLTAVLFEGNAPSIVDGAFEWVTATAYYPAGNATWTANMMQDYGGTLMWTAYTDVVILEQPTDVPVVPEGTVEFSVLAYGDGLTYQWWVAAPGSDTFEKTEVTESTFTVNVDWNSIGLRTYCVVTDSNGNTLQSEIATVTKLPVMYEEETVDVVIDTAGKWVYYEFVPNYSCRYLFYCRGYGTSYVYLYDSEMNLLVHDLSGSYDMEFDCFLEAGKSYTFAARCKDQNITGRVRVTAWIDHEYDYQVDTNATCTTDGQGKYTCIYCGDSYTETIVGAHQNVDDVCSVCGAQLCGEKLTWSFDEATGTLTISGSGDMYNHYWYDNRPWFDVLEKITAVVIEDGVTGIGQCAFLSCENLKTVKICDTVASIGERAFAGCTALETVVIPDSVSNLGDFAFVNCTALKNLTIGNGVSSLGQWVFGQCTSLTTVHIPASVEVINSAFENCSSLKELTGCAGLEYLSGWDFKQTTAIQAIWIDDANASYCSDENGWVYSKDMTTLVWAPAFVSGDVVIPEGVTTIGESAFEGCNGIAGITLPQSLATIEEYAFSGCNGLTSVTIPNSVTTLGYGAFCYCDGLKTITVGSGVTEGLESAFENCDNLTSLTVSEDNANYSVDEYGVLFNKDKTMLYRMPKSFTGNYAVPGSVATIAGGAFSACTGLTGITLPAGLTTIGYEAFRGCSAITSIVIPEGVTEIGGYTFSGCTALASVTIPESVTAIGYHAFADCTALNNVILPEGLTTIDGYAYLGCTALQKIIIPNSVTYLGEYAFCDCESLVSVVLPDGLTAIPNGVFAATGLTEYAIPDGIISIGANAFAGCKALKTIHIPAGVTSIGELAFIDCDALEAIAIPSTVTYIGNFAFSYCDALSKIEFLGSVPQFYADIFYDVTADAYYPAGDDTWTPEMMEYFGGKLTWYSSDGELALFHLSGTNVALGSNLAMNFFIDKDYLSGGDYYAVITHYDHETENHVYTIPYTQWENRQDYMVVTLENLAAKNMIDYIEVQVFRADGTPCTAVRGDSVESYALRIFDAQDDATKTLLVDMLNYGAAAQTYFGYRDSYLVNADLTEEQQAYATQSVTCTDQRIEGENYIGSTLVLENRIQLTMYFQKITTDMYAVVSYTDHDGNAQELTVSGSDFAQYNENIYGVTVETLAVADGDQLVTVTVYDADGNAVAGASDTVNGYLSRMMSGDEIFEAIAKFTNSAYAYFHQD